MIRDRQTGQIYHDGEFRTMHANTSFPQQLTQELLDSFGADVVFEGPQPETTRYQMVVRQGTIQMADGNWYTNYVAIDMSDQAKNALDNTQAAAIRADRNVRLAATDWWVTKAVESGQMLDDSLAAYRKALRDITKQPGFPWDIVWPEAPQ
jgi:hypothetical protein